MSNNKILLLVIAAIILILCSIAYSQGVEPTTTTPTPVVEQPVLQDTVAHDPNTTLDLILTLLPWCVSLITIVISAIKLRRSGKSWAETYTIIVNTLKDEQKMVDGGFSADTIQKAKDVANVIGAGSEAQKKVEEVLTQGKEQDIKIGSINGKPIYLGSALGIGSALASIANQFRKK